ncbi:MAG: hypothetical protein JNK11_00550 [Alphaproteobacteria bacterium]|nr:hypothetical protein [Alphaproteobacteria bacterium]
MADDGTRGGETRPIQAPPQRSRRGALARAALGAGLGIALAGCGSDIQVTERGRDGLTLCAAMTSVTDDGLDKFGRDHCARFGMDAQRQKRSYFSCGGTETGVTVRYDCVPTRPLRPALPARAP